MGRVLTIVKKNMRRSPYQALAASMVMFLTFLALLSFAIIGVGSQLILKHYESKPQTIAFFKDNTSENDVKAIQNSLMETGKVAGLKFVSKKEALKIYQERNKDNPALLELVTASILPSSLEISALDPSDLGSIAEILKKEPVVEEVVYPKDVVEALTQATAIIRITGLSVVSFLLIFSLLIILMVIGFKIRLKRSEIETMRLLGASSWFIRAPFIFEGVAYGVFGAVLAWSFSYLLLWYLTPFLQNTLGEIELLPVSPLFMLGLLGASILFAFIIGCVGSFGAVKRYLKL